MSDAKPRRRHPASIASVEQAKMKEDALRSALERVTANFEALLAGKPVRDADETIA